jgi:hypothetical protein
MPYAVWQVMLRFFSKRCEYLSPYFLYQLGAMYRIAWLERNDYA